MSKEVRLWIAGGVLITAAVWLAVLWLPEWMANQFYFKTADAWMAQVTANRTVIVNMVGGLAVGITVYFTYQNFKISQNTLAVSQNNEKMANEKELVDNFYQAVEQLGNAQESVRLGGIFLLARTAERSREQYFPIMQILTGHIRSKYPNTSQPPSTRCPVEVQTILMIVGCRYFPDPDGISLDLSYTRISEAWIPEADFQCVYFWGAILTNVNFEGTKLAGADFRGATLDSCSFNGADLEGTDFLNAKIVNPIGLTADQLSKAVNVGPDVKPS